ncbi:MAG TPA: hypothetical protein VF460_11080 [Burkholderiales bacterium]
MKTILRTLTLAAMVAGLGAMEAVMAQTPDNPDRKETTRERENPARGEQPAERDNQERMDPLMSAELQKCYAVPEAEKEQCITEVKRKFGEL